MASTTEPSLVVFAWGNESRGDDGAGPELARRLIELSPPGLVVIEDMQLQVEHVTDIVAGVPVLFIDASVAIESGWALERVQAGDDPSVTTHAVSPRALLRLYETTMGQPVPTAWQLHISGRQFELGEALGAASREAIEGAWQFPRDLLTNPPSRWARGLAEQCGKDPDALAGELETSAPAL